MPCEGCLVEPDITSEGRHQLFARVEPLLHLKLAGNPNLLLCLSPPLHVGLEAIDVRSSSCSGCFTYLLFWFWRDRETVKDRQKEGDSLNSTSACIKM